MTATSVTAVTPATPVTPPPGRTIVERHRALLCFLLVFVALFAVLLVKNRDLFDLRIHEDGDFAANSIIIDDAEHFDLLVGNYSRQGFSHPGPADFYVQAAGEKVLHDWLGIVPEPFNGQAIAMLALNAALIALALTILAVETRSRVALVGAFAVAIVFAGAHDFVLASTWMPYVYFAPFVAFLVAGASVASGNTRFLWVLALAGGFLVHGHVEFVVFVPIMTLVALVAGARGRWRVMRESIAAHRAHWIAFAAVLGLFLFPIVLNLVLHYPGEFDEYWDYATSNQAGGHSFSAAIDYVLSFWSGDADGGLVLPLVIVGTAVLLAVNTRRAETRRFLLAALGMVALATAIFVYYASRGIDDLHSAYIGYFYWAAPLVVLFVVVAGLAPLLPRGTPWTWGALALCALVVVAAMRGDGLVNPYRGEPTLPAVVHAMADARTDRGGPLVLTLEQPADYQPMWPDALGVIVEAQRKGIRACMADRSFEFLVTSEFVCSPQDVERGTEFAFREPGRGTDPVLVTAPRSEVVLTS